MKKKNNFPPGTVNYSDLKQDKMKQGEMTDSKRIEFIKSRLAPKYPATYEQVEIFIAGMIRATCNEQNIQEILMSLYKKTRDEDFLNKYFELRSRAIRQLSQAE